MKRANSAYSNTRRKEGFNSLRKEHSMLDDAMKYSNNMTRTQVNQLLTTQERAMNKNPSQESLGNTDLRSTSALKQIYELNPQEKLVAGKLGYEWKNIYRNLTQIDAEDTGLIELREFDEVCYRFKARLTKDELSRLKKQFCVPNENGEELQSIADKQTISGERDLINYKRISHYFGLHKDSLNHLSSMQMSVNRVKKLF
jgi:hypothetical protein